MSIFNTIANLFNATVGRNQEFEQLIVAKDIGRVISLMDNHHQEADEALKEYNPKTHVIMERKDKILKDLTGKRKGTLARWKLPVGYPVYINEMSLVFIFGQPVKWVQLSDDTDDGFKAFTDLLTRMHINSKIRQCKRLAGSETESAMLFRVFRNNEGQADCQIRVLARSKGDEIYTRWDVYENLITFAWGHYSKDISGKTTYHVDIFTDHTIYHCQRGSLVIKAALLKSMPNKDVENKTLVASDNVDDVSKLAGFLTWDGQNESKKDEIEWLKHHILTKTFTPDVDWSQMKGLSAMSGKALKQMMLLADIKATKHKELYDELLDRIGSLVISIMSNVLYINRGELKLNELKVQATYREPFGEDVAEVIKNINDSIEGGTMSEESGIEQNPLVKDKQLEKARVMKQREQAAREQRDLFAGTQEKADVYGDVE